MKKTFEIFTKFFALAICACAFHTPGVAATSDIVNNKTSKFNETLADISAKSTDTSTDARADSIRRQRALLDNAGKQDATQNTPKTSSATKCDNALRKCMAEKCGSDFTKCAKDSTAIWGDKMDSCRRKTECTAREYTLLAPEILADRDTNERMSHYNSVITCGKNYNSCIFAECGTTLNKCLAKSDGDRAISKCESVARTCRSQDSGLAARAMTVFGDMRTVATAQAAKDEARLRELRDLMRTQCNRFGAMFDERTLDCVYTVNFFAGDDTTTPKASKKLYAGDSFQCNANWFGVDVTTFKENAYRRTRAQTSASSAAMGAGVGTAVGLVTSGAVGRALETQKAKKEMDKEQAAADKAACEAQDGKTWDGKKCVDATGTPTTEQKKQTNGAGNKKTENKAKEKTDKKAEDEKTLYEKLNDTLKTSGATDKVLDALRTANAKEKENPDATNITSAPQKQQNQTTQNIETVNATPGEHSYPNVVAGSYDPDRKIEYYNETFTFNVTTNTEGATLKNIDVFCTPAPKETLTIFQNTIIIPSPAKNAICHISAEGCLTVAHSIRKWIELRQKSSVITLDCSDQKKNDRVTSESPRGQVAQGKDTATTAVATQSATIQSTSNRKNCDYAAMRNKMQFDTPIDLSKCKEAEIKLNKSILENGCTSLAAKMQILGRDNRVKNIEVTPTLANDKFTCKIDNLVTTTINNVATVDKWDSETRPTAAECADTCAKITAVTDLGDTYRKFPGNPQCLKICAPYVETACQNLVGKQWVNEPIQRVESRYQMDDKNVLHYSCTYFGRSK